MQGHCRQNPEKGNWLSTGQAIYSRHSFRIVPAKRAFRATMRFFEVSVSRIWGGKVSNTSSGFQVPSHQRPDSSLETRMP
jgi:hypothetical protein